MHFDNGHRILIADGDRAVLEMLQIRLDVAGYRVSIARSGPTAIEMMRSTLPHALIMDLNLPEQNGFEVLKLLNPQGGRMTTPVLVMGRKLSIEDIQKAVSMGARDALAKPFSGADFLDRVARLFRQPAPAAAPRPAQAHAHA
jgi:DNA-binding response OmpR family regulator